MHIVSCAYIYFPLLRRCYITMRILVFVSRSGGTSRNHPKWMLSWLRGGRLEHSSTASQLERGECAKVRVERTTWWKFVGVSSTKKYSHTQAIHYPPNMPYVGTRLTKKSWNTISFILALRSNSHMATSLTCGEYLLECLTISCRKAGLWPSHQFPSQCVNHGITSYVYNTNLQGHLLSLLTMRVSHCFCKNHHQPVVIFCGTWPQDTL